MEELSSNVNYWDSVILELLKILWFFTLDRFTFFCFFRILIGYLHTFKDSFEFNFIRHMKYLNISIVNKYIIYLNEIAR